MCTFGGFGSAGTVGGFGSVHCWRGRGSVHTRGKRCKDTAWAVVCAQTVGSAVQAVGGAGGVHKFDEVHRVPQSVVSVVCTQSVGMLEVKESVGNAVCTQQEGRAEETQSVGRQCSHNGGVVGVCTVCGVGGGCTVGGWVARAPMSRVGVCAHSEWLSVHEQLARSVVHAQLAGSALWTQMGSAVRAQKPQVVVHALSAV